MGLVDIDFMALVGAICMCDRGDRADGFDVFKKAGGEDFKCVQTDLGGGLGISISLIFWVRGCDGRGYVQRGFEYHRRESGL